MLIKNAKILTMAREDYDKGDIRVKDGVIQELGESLALEAGEEVFDAAGMTAMPGIVDPHCHIGMWEDGMGDEGADGNEATDPVTPEMRAIDGINPMDRCFTEAREAGVTTVVTGPGSANVVGGQFLAMKTFGNRVDDMVIKEPCALKVAFGENPKRVYAGQKKAPTTRMATAAILREAFVEAQNYLNEMSDDNPPARNLKKEVLALALDGKIPVKAHAHRADDILTALRIAREFDLKITLDHCTEGYLIPEHIKEANVPVILGPLVSERSKIELRNMNIEAPRILWEHGIEFAIMTDHPVVPVQYLPLCAALAVRAGLPESEALRAITINAAKACGIEDRVGSLEPEKDADIVLYEGDPLDLRTKIAAVWIDGKRIK